MPVLPLSENLENTELVICDSETASQAHIELFRTSDNKYIISDKFTSILDSLSHIINTHYSSPSLKKIHLVMGWSNILQVSLWQAAKPAVGDIFTLLRNEGIKSEELQPFKTSDINDIFPWLYYGKRFDTLRRLCHIAKRKAEGNFKKYSIAVECHIIAEDTKKIVASSL
ncbi:MAG: hypothetical protein QMD07_04005 [Thermodesulfovibrionales bacterium]|nr:hypothetical protein [Thermodesulfovibrionales bacterium]